jgi:ssDNA-binding Zn-finger/Zn-ribbon topoisomerase 1
MILKSADSKKLDVDELEHLAKIAPARRRAEIELELRCLRSGIKGEAESAYLIDFDFKEAPNTAIIHDLRLEINGRVAQIDHLLIHRTLNCFVLETKNFHSGIKITEDGDFLMWNDFKKTYEGMASPLTQNERHIAVLKAAFDQIQLPTRAGIKLSPTFHSYVLVAPKARIERPKFFDTSHIIKSDIIMKTILKQYDDDSFLDTVTNLARIISRDTLTAIGRQLVTLHKPVHFNYKLKFGFDKNEATPTALSEPIASIPNTSPVCPFCGSEMVKRIARKGTNPGQEFFGCVSYPKCRGIRQLDEVPIPKPSVSPDQLAQTVTMPEKSNCPDCGSEMALRKFQSGPKLGQSFYGCIPCKKGWPTEQILASKVKF